MVAIGLILLLTVVFQHVQCHTYYFGNCPRVEPVEQFDLNKFLGRWYVIQKFSTASSCWTYDFIRNNTDGSLKVIQSRDHVALDTFGLDNNYRYTGSLDVPDPNRPGFMRVRFPLSVAGKADYIVFATDYDHYGAIYTCQKVLFGHRRSASILSRTPTLDQPYITKIRAKLENAGVDPHDFSIIDHTDCHTLPSTSLLNFGIGPDTFSATNVAGVVKDAGHAIGNGINRVAEGVGQIYNRPTEHPTTVSRAEQITNPPNGGHPDQDAEMVPANYRPARIP